MTLFNPTSSSKVEWLPFYIPNRWWEAETKHAWSRRKRIEENVIESWVLFGKLDGWACGGFDCLNAHRHPCVSRLQSSGKSGPGKPSAFLERSPFLSTESWHFEMWSSQTTCHIQRFDMRLRWDRQEWQMAPICYSFRSHCSLCCPPPSSLSAFVSRFFITEL